MVECVTKHAEALDGCELVTTGTTGTCIADR